MQWVSVAAFGKAAEIAGELKKADRVYVEGTIKLDAWRGGAGIDRIGQSVDMITTRLNWRFGWGSPVVARY